MGEEMVFHEQITGRAEVNVSGLATLMKSYIRNKSAIKSTYSRYKKE